VFNDTTNASDNSDMFDSTNFIHPTASEIAALTSTSGAVYEYE